MNREVDQMVLRLRDAANAGRIDQDGRRQLTDSLSLAVGVGEAHLRHRIRTSLGWDLPPPPPPSPVPDGASTRCHITTALLSTHLPRPRSGKQGPPSSGGATNGDADRQMVNLLEERNNDLEAQLTDVWDQVRTCAHAAAGGRTRRSTT